jgi:membrane protease YdiL (CAAX protease family)
MQKEIRLVSQFFIATFVLSWIIWIPLAIMNIYVKEFPWLFIMAIGGISPSLIGLLLGIRYDVYSKSTFKQMHRIGFPQLKMIAIFVIIFVGAFICSLFLDLLLFQHKPYIKNVTQYFGRPIISIVSMITFIYSGPLSEEYGWRGFIVSVLSKKRSLFFIGTITGVLWSIWHYPLFFLNGQYSITNYGLHIFLHIFRHISLSIIATYLFIKSDYCIWGSIIIHMLSNILFSLFSPMDVSLTIINVLILVCVSCILLNHDRMQILKQRAA